MEFQRGWIPASQSQTSSGHAMLRCCLQASEPPTDQIQERCCDLQRKAVSQLMPGRNWNKKQTKRQFGPETQVVNFEKSSPLDRLIRASVMLNKTRKLTSTISRFVLRFCQKFLTSLANGRFSMDLNCYPNRITLRLLFSFKVSLKPLPQKMQVQIA